MTKAFQFAAIIAVVAGVQWMFAVQFSSDEVERIVVTILGLVGIDLATTNRRRKE